MTTTKPEPTIGGPNLKWNASTWHDWARDTWGKGYTDTSPLHMLIATAFECEAWMARAIQAERELAGIGMRGSPPPGGSLIQRHAVELAEAKRERDAWKGASDAGLRTLATYEKRAQDAEADLAEAKRRAEELSGQRDHFYAHVKRMEGIFGLRACYPDIDFGDQALPPEQHVHDGNTELGCVDCLKADHSALIARLREKWPHIELVMKLVNYDGPVPRAERPAARDPGPPTCLRCVIEELIEGTKPLNVVA